MSGTAKRLSLKAQGCFNPGEQMQILINPERVAPAGRNRVAVESAIWALYPGSRIGRIDL